jgi:uncharacterized protein
VTPKISGFFGSALQKNLIFVILIIYRMYIKRNIEEKIRKHIGRKEYTIITGARQTGKTTLLRELYSQLKKENAIAFYVSFENREVLQQINENPENIFKYAIRPGQSNGDHEITEPVYIFIDEIQYADDPSNFLKYLYDKYLENLKIVATGSSAFYLDTGFDDSLAGRKRLFTMLTLSFEEFLNFKNLDHLRQELEFLNMQKDYVSTHTSELLDAFNEYLVFGGYPAIVLENDKTEKIALLKDIRDSFLKRDVDEAGIINLDAFYKLFTLLAGQSGNLLNKSELSGTIGVDNKTVDNYLMVLQKCFHIELVRPFSTNLRKEMTKMPKVFLYDTGMRNAMLNRFTNFDDREDKGALLENYVFRRLAEIHEPKNVRYWRTTDNKEIDFIISFDFRSGWAYEVKMDCKIRKRGGILTFRELYPDFKFEMLTYEFCDDTKQVFKF